MRICIINYIKTYFLAFTYYHVPFVSLPAKFIGNSTKEFLSIK